MKEYIRDLHGDDLKGQVSFNYRDCEVSLSSIAGGKFLDIAIFKGGEYRTNGFTTVESALVAGAASGGLSR